MTARKMSLCCARCWLLSSSSTRGKTVQQPQQQEAVATFFFIRRSIRFRMMIIICYCSLWPAREPRSISFSELVKIRLRGVRHWQRGTCFWLCDHRFFLLLVGSLLHARSLSELKPMACMCTCDCMCASIDWRVREGFDRDGHGHA